MLIETQAGAGIGSNDDEYIAVGATIAVEAADVFSKANMIIKVKEPQPSEWARCHLIRFYLLFCIWPLMRRKPMVLLIRMHRDRI